MFRVINPSIASSKLFAPRMKIVKQHPHLLGRIADQMGRMTEQLTKAIRLIPAGRARFRRRGRGRGRALDRGVARPVQRCRARVIKEWATNGNATPIEAVENRAIELMRDTVKRLK
ncbi:MAG: hypothetical protein WDM88_00350 [Galbitalea sp.]